MGGGNSHQRAVEAAKKRHRAQPSVETGAARDPSGVGPSVDRNTIWPLVGLIVTLTLFLILRNRATCAAIGLMLCASWCWLGFHICRAKAGGRRWPYAIVVLVSLSLSGFATYQGWPARTGAHLDFQGLDFEDTYIGVFCRNFGDSRADYSVTATGIASVPLNDTQRVSQSVQDDAWNDFESARNEHSSEMNLRAIEPGARKEAIFSDSNVSGFKFTPG